MLSFAEQYAEVTKVLGDLLESDRATNGHPRIAASDRKIIEPLLERVIVNQHWYNDYVRVLMGSVKTYRHADLLPVEEENKVLEIGLQGLGDEAFATFSLNPIAIGGVRDAVEHELPNFWISLIEKDGVAMLETLPLDTFGQPRIFDGGVGSGIGAPMTSSEAYSFVMNLGSEIAEESQKERDAEARLLDSWGDDDLLAGEDG